MTTTFGRSLISASILISLMACAGASQTGSPPGSAKVVATVNGQTVTDADLKKASAAQLENLEVKKVQAQLGLQREEQSILEGALDSIIADKVIEAEAKKRGISTQELIQSEVEVKVPVPTDAEVNAFYEQNKSRINIPGEEALRQVRVYLRQQNRDSVLDAFVTKLRNDYKVESFLAPLRMTIATEGFPTKGPSTAPVTIVEFSDFECPFCAALFPTLQLVEANYQGKIKVVFRQFPLFTIHPHAQKAAEASLCANEQKKFWEMHDAMFKDNRKLEIVDLKKKAADLKLDSKIFDACLDSSKYADGIKKEIEEGVRAGVTGTPVMFINGRFFNGALSYADVAKIIDEELKKK